MTNQQAEALASRLTRIWAPIGIERIEREDTCFVWFSRLPNGFFLDFRLWHNQPHNEPDIKLRKWGEWRQIHFDIVNGVWVANIPDGYGADAKQFIADSCPLFRRNCFLSGCPIEATAHEKWEWILDARERGVLTEEELQGLLCVSSGL